MFRFSTAAVACALALSASASMAASQSSSAITGLTFTLIDLNPRDGIAPSFNFVSSSGSTLLSVSATDNALGESESASRTRAGTFAFTKEYLAQLSNANSKASTGPQSLSASGSAAGSQTSYSASASTGANSNSYYYGPLNLSLSANSLLLINANVELSASASNPLACYSYYNCTSESAAASASLYLAYSFNSAGVSTSYSANLTSSLNAVAQGASTTYWGYQYNPATGYYESVYITTPKLEESKSLSDVLTGVFTNSSNQTQLASLGLAVSASGSASTVPEVSTLGLVAAGALVLTGVGRASASAVPEPGSYALVLAGLGMVGLMLRRRRQS